MKRSILLAVAWVLLLIAMPTASAGKSGQERSVAAVKRLGGKVEVDSSDTAKPVVVVNLNETTVADSDLKLLRPLRGLPELYLVNTAVTDAGLVHLKGLVQLRKLGLGGTKVSSSWGSVERFQSASVTIQALLSRKSVTHPSRASLPALTTATLLGP
jgi:hypothetical protein